MTITVYFVDGVPAMLDGVTLEELFSVWRLVNRGKCRAYCDFRCGRKTVSLDLSCIEPKTTFGDLWERQEYK